MRFQDDDVLALMCGSREPNWARADLGRQRRARCLVNTRRGRGELQIAWRAEGRGAQVAQRLLRPRIGRGNVAERPHQAPPRRTPACPAPQRTRAHARVHKRQLHAARLGFEDEVGPKLALDEDSNVGAPMIQEPPHAIGAIERGINMRRSRQGAARHQIGGCPRAGGDQERKRRIARRQRFDQRKRHATLADARRMQPDQRTAGARCRIAPKAFAQTRRVLLAALGAVVEVEPRERTQRRTRGAI